MNSIDQLDVASIVKWKGDNPAHTQGMVHHPDEKLKKSICNNYTLKKPKLTMKLNSQFAQIKFIKKGKYASIMLLINKFCVDN